MMNTMKQWQMRFENEGRVRAVIYFMALLLTFINWRAVPDGTEASSARVVICIFTIPATLAIYYISGGIEGCYSVIKTLAKVVNFFFILLILLCPFAVGWIMIFSTILSGMWCCFAAYVLPIIGVPLTGFVRRRMLR